MHLAEQLDNKDKCNRCSFPTTQFPRWEVLQLLNLDLSQTSNHKDIQGKNLRTESDIYFGIIGSQQKVKYGYIPVPTNTPIYAHNHGDGRHQKRHLLQEKPEST